MIGHLTNRRLTVFRPTRTIDAVGGISTEFVDVGQVRCMVSQPTAEERRVAQQQGTNLTHHVHMRHGAPVQRGDMLGGDLPSDVPEGARLRVVSVVSDSRSTYHRAACEITQAEA